MTNFHFLATLFSLLFMLLTPLQIDAELRAIYTDGVDSWIYNNVDFSKNSEFSEKPMLQLYKDLDYNTIFDWISPLLHCSKDNWSVDENGFCTLDEQSKNTILQELEKRYELCTKYGLQYRPHYFSWGHGKREQAITPLTKYQNGITRNFNIELSSVSYIATHSSIPKTLQWLGDDIFFGTESKDWFLSFTRTPQEDYNRHIDPFSTATKTIFTEMTAIIAEFYKSHNITPEYYLINSDEAPRVNEGVNSFGEYFAAVINDRVATIDTFFGKNRPEKVLIWADMITPIGTFFDYYNKDKSSLALDILDTLRVVPVLWLYAQHNIEFSNENFTVSNGSDRTALQRIEESANLLDKKGFDYIFTFATDYDKTGGGVFPVDDPIVESILSAIPIVGNISHVAAWGVAFSCWESYKKNISIQDQNCAAKEYYSLLKKRKRFKGSIFAFWGDRFDHRVNGLEFQSAYGWRDVEQSVIDNDSNMILDCLEGGR